MTLAECMDQPIWRPMLALSWFLQMGVHEFMHAEVAYRRGDDTASLLGKRTMNPLAHIEWSNPMGILVSVVAPIWTAFYYVVPMGMAWVPINPYRLKRGDKDFALVALAGPVGNFLLSGFCLIVHFGVLRFLPENEHTAGIEAFFAAIYMTSIAYGVFNLLPIPPIDGGRLLYPIVPTRHRHYLDSVASWGLLIAVLVMQSPVGGALLRVMIYFWSLYR